MKPQEENKYYCDVCKNAIGKIQNVLSFEGAINKKDWVDYTLCWECSKKLRKDILKLKKSYEN